MRFPSPLPSISPTVRSFALIAFALVSVLLGMIPFLVVPALRR